MSESMSAEDLELYNKKLPESEATYGLFGGDENDSISIDDLNTNAANDEKYWYQVFEEVRNPNGDAHSRGLALKEFYHCPKDTKRKILNKLSNNVGSDYVNTLINAILDDGFKGNGLVKIFDELEAQGGGKPDGSLTVEEDAQSKRIDTTGDTNVNSALRAAGNYGRVLDREKGKISESDQAEIDKLDKAANDMKSNGALRLMAESQKNKIKNGDIYEKPMVGGK